MAEVIVIEGMAFPARPHSDAPDAQDCAEEDLAFAARDTLEDIRRSRSLPVGFDCWQAFFCTAAKVVAKHYGVGYDALCEEWARHYGLTVLTEAP